MNWSCDELPLDGIYCLDCRVGMKKLPDKCVDVVITSPPYNAGITINEQTDMYQNFHDDLHQRFYLDFLKVCIDEMLRISKKYVFLNIAEIANNKWALHQFIAYSNYLKQMLIWEKDTVAPAMNRSIITKNHELILVYDKQQPMMMSYIDLDFGNKGEIKSIWRGPSNRDFHCEENHAIFPLWLPRKIMDLFTKPGDIVLDPFMGVGTVAVVAQHMDRHFIGFEIDQKQIDIAKGRLNQKALHAFINDGNK